ncbi:hypothetical protein HZA86_01380 [Candidatus Uhrbacteria bacterium]|nr:hypothetical protein [Candidatus Uhrbacteria bacterium]
MYSYLYDTYLANPRYQRMLAAIETRLNDLEIHGNICRITPLKNLRDVLEQEQSRGSTTIVAVGDDSLVERLVALLATMNSPVILGIIPVGGESHDIAKLLSIPAGVDACNILSYRMVRILRLGKINNRFFLVNVHCEGKFSIQCDGAFTVQPRENKTLSIRVRNNPYEDTGTVVPALKMTMRIEGRALPALHPGSESVFSNHRFVIRSKERLDLYIDEHRVIASSPITIEGSNKKIRVITGALRPSIRSTIALNQKLMERKRPNEVFWS